MNKEYRLAIAFLQLKRAYSELVAASQALPDLDVTANYPFYLLDFEGIKDQVSAWCTIQAANLLRELPDKVDNPVCAACEFFKIGLLADGLCKAASQKNCGVYPLIVFSKEQVAPFMAKYGTPVTTDSTELDVYLAYMRKLEEIYDSRQTEASTKDSSAHTNADSTTDNTDKQLL